MIALAIGYPVAYAIAKLPSRWRTVVLVLVVIPFWTNFLIRTYAWIVLLNTQGVLNDALVGLGVIDEPLTLLYTQGAVVAGLRLRLPAPDDPADLRVGGPAGPRAARGVRRPRRAAASRRSAEVTLPLSLPGVVTGCIFVFVPSLGNFVVPELLGGGKTVMVGNLIRDQFLKARDWPFGATLALFMVVLLVLLFALQSVVSRRYSLDARR